MDSTDAAMPASAHVGRVGLAVNDLDAMVQFYADVVGLHVRSRDDDSATLGAGGDPLLVLRADPDAPERGREEAGLFHTAFRLPARAALGDALNRVQDRWQLSGASNHLVSEALYLSDPEGNGVEIYWDRPREEWPVTDEGRVGMDTLPLELDGLRAVAAGDDAVPPDTDVGHVHLEVTNLGGAREFYVDGLGLGVRQAFGDAALFVAAGEYHHHVGLNTWNGRSGPASADSRGLDWFELVVPDEAALDTVRSRLIDQGAAVESTDGGLALSDADGIGLRLRR
jgi:catechol 2,3-dioxygenase